MPHINDSQKEKYSELLYRLHETTIHNKGELEFLVFRLMRQYMKTREMRYSDLHEVVYAVIHSAEEFKRLYLDKREDQAIAENGEA